MAKVLKYGSLLLFFGALISVRAFENDLFYDPYIKFFKGKYISADSPDINMFKLIIHIGFRYALNTIISLGILYTVFKDLSIVKFSFIIYSIAFILLIILFLFFAINPKQEMHYLLFNIRRFLIQPILLILLLPAFFYYKKTQ